MSLFDYNYSEQPRIQVQVAYKDGSIRLFDNEDWFIYKDGIKEKLQDKGLLKEVKLI
jgi:hypothetical protein